MRELRDISSAFAALRQIRGLAVLASVVHVEGSTYRRPGARALVLSDDRVVGLVSGGCLEGDLVARARAVRETGEALRLRYDSRGDDDLVFGLGLGCRGVVDVLLERVSCDTPGPLDFLAGCLRGREIGALATVIRAGSGGSPPLAARWMLRADVLTAPPGAEPRLTQRVREAALRTLAAGKSRLLRSGGAEILVEPVRPPVRLVLLGAGPDAPPLARVGVELGWEVIAADARPAYARADRLPGAERVLLCGPEAADALVPIDTDTAALVMTHQVERDRAWLRWLLPSAARYVGVLGPKERTRELLDGLLHAGFAPTEAQLARLHAPAGLDIGADTPHEIALSVAAEIQAVFAGHPGGPLRERKGPIHEGSP